MFVEADRAAILSCARSLAKKLRLEKNTALTLHENPFCLKSTLCGLHRAVF
jgi:hypothetical protein